jgi:uncharacterized membrane protein
MLKVNIKKEKNLVDILTIIIGVLGLIVLIGLPLFYFDNLPERIPIHFGINGQPDGFGDKGMIWLLPIIGVAMYFGFFWLNKFPHLFNYSQQISEENAERLYTINTRMIRTLNAIISCIFAYINYSIIQSALGKQNGLGAWFFPVFILLILGTIGYFLYKTQKIRSL